MIAENVKFMYVCIWYGEISSGIEWCTYVAYSKTFLIRADFFEVIN